MQIRIYVDLTIIPAQTSVQWNVPVPPGNWRVLSLVALATEAGMVGNMPVNVVSSNVQTMIIENQIEKVFASDNGVPHPMIVGGIPLTIFAQRNAPGQQALVKITLTLEQV
jgi:hypothetical protein